METFSEKNVAKSFEREALSGAVGRAGVGNGAGENLLLSKVSESLSMRLELKKHLAEVMSL